MSKRMAALLAVAVAASWPWAVGAQQKSSPADALAQKFSQPSRLGGPFDGPDGPAGDDGPPAVTDRAREAAAAKQEAANARRDAQRLRADEREMLDRARAELNERREERDRARAEVERAERQRAEAEARAIEAARRQEQSRAAQAREQAREAEQRREVAEREAREAEERRRAEEAKAESAKLAAEEAQRREDERRAEAERRLAELEAKAADAERRARDAEERLTDDAPSDPPVIRAEARPSDDAPSRDGVVDLGPGEAFDPTPPSKPTVVTALPPPLVRSTPERDALDDFVDGRDGDDDVAADRGGRVTVLLVMDVRRTGLRIFNPRAADPMICFPDRCLISAGSDSPAAEFTRRRAFGPHIALTVRGGACRMKRRCVFRDVDLRDPPAPLQPIDLRLFRHDRREVVSVSPDSSCRLRRGRLFCGRPFAARDYRLWIVPEDVAREAGPDLLQAAVEAGLPSHEAAAADGY